MCLDIDYSLTEKKKKSKKKVYYFWKAFDISRFGKLITPHADAIVDTKIVEEHNPTEFNDDQSIFPTEISDGALHASTSLLANKLNLPLSYIRLRIKVNKEDIIAWGADKDVCFKKYEFTRLSVWRSKREGVILK